MEKEIAGFQKGVEAHHSTSVTATKGEQVLVWLSVILMFAAIASSVLIWKSPLAMMLSIVGGIVLVALTMLLCMLRPMHRAERQQNAHSEVRNVEDSYNCFDRKTQTVMGTERGREQ